MFSGTRPMKYLFIALLATTRVASAALSTDPFVYDPAFNGGFILEDRFASVTPNTSLLGLHVAIGAPGDSVTSGLVAPAYQGAPPTNFGSTRYDAQGQRESWGGPSSAYTYFTNRYLDYPNDTSNSVGWIGDVKIFEGYLFALVDSPLPSHDVRILTFTDNGQVGS